MGVPEEVHQLLRAVSNYFFKMASVSLANGLKRLEVEGARWKSLKRNLDHHTEG